MGMGPNLEPPVRQTRLMGLPSAIYIGVVPGGSMGRQSYCRPECTGRSRDVRTARRTRDLDPGRLIDLVAPFEDLAPRRHLVSL